MSQMPTRYRVTHEGQPVSMGNVFFYASGTSTLLNTYSNPGLTVPNTNPVTLDNNGEADVYLAASQYQEVVFDADGALLRSRSNINGDALDTAAADQRYVRTGSTTAVDAITDTVIANVRTYECDVTGVAAYTTGDVLNIIPDVVAVTDTGYKINVNGLGAKDMVDSIGGDPILVAGSQTILIYDGTNFVQQIQTALSAGTNSLTLVTTGGATPSNLSVLAADGALTIKAEKPSGTSNLFLTAQSSIVLHAPYTTIAGTAFVTVIDGSTPNSGVTVGGVSLKDGGVSATGAITHLTPLSTATGTESVTAEWVTDKGYLQQNNALTWVQVWSGDAASVALADVTGGAVNGLYRIEHIPVFGVNHSATLGYAGSGSVERVVVLTDCTAANVLYVVTGKCVSDAVSLEYETHNLSTGGTTSSGALNIKRIFRLT